MRSLFALILSLVVVTGASAAPVKRLPRLVFPVVGAVSYHDDFGEPRAGGRHQGNDILADRRAPAVAVEAGTVQFWTTSATAGCMLYLHGDSGTTYLYIHLNNDLTSHNDNRGTCVAGTAYAPRLKNGAHVEAGQLVGFVGDSGDANGIHPHLHFEVHPNNGGAVDPYPYLRKAQSLLFAAKRGATVSLTLGGTIVTSFGEAVELKASRVRTNASKAVTLQRSLVLGIADDADVSLDVPPVPVGLDALLPGRKATVYTEPVRVTLAAQRGDDEALTASRIVLKR